jgi:membrane associated rhomboid family serine protease
MTPEYAVVLQGSSALCREYSLMLEARGIEHELQPADAQWQLTVASALTARAEEEIRRYAAERRMVRAPIARFEPFAVGWVGAATFVVVLLMVAYAAGLQMFGTDWFSVGALRAGAAHSQWWRAITAVTLHVDPLHLFSNVFAGLVVGAAASQLLGPGIAWSAALACASAGNYVEMWVAPPAHQAVGASSLVFAALGLVTGLAWSHRLGLREARWYRWAPLIVGACMLALFGAGGERVDVLGHLLGFLFGTVGGALLAWARIPRDRANRTQWLCGGAAVFSIGCAWILALNSSPSP